MKGCDLMDPRFTCYVSTDRFLTLCVQCQGVAVFSVGGWLCSVSGGGWHKLAHRDISAGFMLCRRGMGM